jgi:hypothetical protein
VRSSSESIEKLAEALKQDLDTRLAAIQALLRAGLAA